MNRFEYVNAGSLEEARNLLQGAEGSAFLAGGIDLIDQMKEGISSPIRLVNLKSISGLDQIKYDAQDGLRLGPLVTLAELTENSIIKEYYPALAEAAHRAATPQIRNQATLGGNLCQRPRCWYFRGELFPCLKKGGAFCYAVNGENQYHAILGGRPCYIVHPSSVATPLIAYNASIEITGPGGSQDVNLEEFFILPRDDVERETILTEDSIITEIQIPALPAGSKSIAIEQREMQAHDWAISAVSIWVHVDGGICRDARVVLGAVAPIPWRVRSAEAALKGKRLDAESAASAAEAALAGADPLANNAYKVPLTKAMVRRAVMALA